MTFKTILAAASGGSASDGTIELACRFARRFGAHLEAFHAKPDPRDLFAYSTDAFGNSMSGDFVDRFVKDSDGIAAKTKASF
jgi:nucleotide-binding universal stress UspA family protein